MNLDNVTTDIESRWQTNVNKAKEFIQNRKTSQMQIAALALEVCEISWGGHSSKNLYTLRRFAKEIGAPEKQLSTWISVKTRVYDKLSTKAKNTEPTYSRLLRLTCRVSKDASSDVVEEEFKRLVDDKNLDYALITYLASIRSASTSLNNKERSEKVSENVLKEYLFYCESISKAIRKIDRKLKPENLGLASDSKHRRFSAAAALGVTRGDGKKYGTILVKDAKGFDVRITEKDRLVLNYLRGKKKFYSPTELGIKLKGHNVSSASAWAYRTLNKLQSLEYVERNSRGHYRWAGDQK